MHQVPGYSCGPNQDLLHRQLWQPCERIDTVTGFLTFSTLINPAKPFFFFLPLLQSPSTVVGRGSEFELWKAGYYTVVHFPNQELTILWDHKTTVHITAGPRWKVWPEQYSKSRNVKDSKKIEAENLPFSLCSSRAFSLDSVAILTA